MQSKSSPQLDLLLLVCSYNYMWLLRKVNEGLGRSLDSLTKVLLSFFLPFSLVPLANKRALRKVGQEVERDRFISKTELLFLSYGILLSKERDKEVPV